MTLQPRIDAKQAAQNMGDVAPPYKAQEARIEATRCLYCFDAPCIHSCPTGIDVPGFIKQIAEGRDAAAARTILEANPLGASCARVCPTEVLCEGACVLLDRDQRPIEIGRLQRHATDYVFAHDIEVLSAPTHKSGHKVACVGGGPAGLACATELARLGHDVTVFEQQQEAGGLNTYGVAYYKMPPKISLDEVRMIEGLGVEIRTGVSVGSDISGKELLEQFAAVFVGVGLGRTYSLGLEGEDLPGVVEALDFIKEIRTKPLHEVAVGRRVAVIGCGNTAIDAVTQSKRLGAEVAAIIYRRGPEAMPAYEFEYDLAKRDGAEFLFHRQPVAILGDAAVTGLRLGSTAVGSDGRLQVDAQSVVDMPFDMVIKALGQERMQENLQRVFPDLQFTKSGEIERDFSTGATSVPRVFAGGDAANGGSEVVDAVAEGKRAAQSIHAELTGATSGAHVQESRLGVPTGPATGAGINCPVRVPALEADYHKKQGGE
ncbi:MAG: NAD(P)-dependent oxidoreductase [Planctomycetota bacterium]